ncbi:MAG TPA: Uma2 family endonuclease [Terriglobales bacterium]|nr:Uma2 family endonuclease [Terriglobales bacterium]
MALPDDGKRYELHDGELSVTPAPGLRHQDVLINLTLILVPHVRAAGNGKCLIAPFDCIMSDITVVQPDLLYVEPERLRAISERGVEGAPTLAIEILSPSTRQIDQRRKLALYARHGVTWYWIVDPIARTIEVRRLDGDAYRLVATLQGETARALPPFDDLPLDPAAVWR